MRTRPTLSALVFAGAVALSIAAAILMHVFERAGAKAEFQADAREMHQELEARLGSLVALLRGAAGLHGTLGIASDEVFGSYISRLHLERHYPGVLGIGFARRVPRDELSRFEEEAQRAFPAFEVRPEPGEAPDAWVVRMLEPLDARNAAAIGFDMGSRPNRRAAMEQAVAAGSPALTGRVVLVQEITPDKQAGFLVYVPVYEGGTVPGEVEARQASALGVSYAPLRAGDFFAPLATPDRPAFEVYADDGSEPMYRSEEIGPDAWTLSLPVTKPESDWTVRYARMKPPASGSVLMVGGLGILLSLALYVATVTAEQRERERNQLYARDASVARAVARMSEGPTDPLPMVERLTDWLVEERLATGAEAWRGTVPVSRRGAPVGEAAIVHELAGMTLRITPRTRESGEWIERVLGQGGWLVERAALHEQARAALERNETALRFADVFVGVLGHDLRNPLNAISTAVQVLQRLEHEPRETEILRRVRASVDRMSRLIDQILDFTRARIGGGIPVRAVPSDLGRIAGDIVGEARTAAPDREIHCQTHGETCAIVDPDRIAQALSNLIGNAIQHGEPGSIVVVVDGQAIDEVQITARNPGVVAPEILPSVFEPFQRGSGSAARLGLGMYIARMIVEAHEGTIAIASTPEGVTEVRIRLPREPRGAASGRGGPTRAPLQGG